MSAYLRMSAPFVPAVTPATTVAAAGALAGAGGGLGGRGGGASRSASSFFSWGRQQTEECDGGRNGLRTVMEGAKHRMMAAVV